MSCLISSDAICYLNDKLEPVPVTKSDTKDPKPSAIAIVLEGYPSLCRGIKDPTGSSILSRRLVESSGYRVISVPYTEFNASDKLVRRVKYLEQKLKQIEEADAIKTTNR
jgi:hypothetical protein